jgi:hypothetical protein
MEVLYQYLAVIQFFRSNGMESKFQSPWTPGFEEAHETLFPLTKWALYNKLNEEK